MSTIEEQIIRLLPDPAKYVVGYADMGGMLSGDYAKYRYAAVFARRLDPEIADAIRHGPNRPYHEHYRAVNKELSGLLADVSKALEGNGIAHRLVEPTVSDRDFSEAYLKTLRSPFSHKMAATRAGLGWIGKTDLLVTHRFGPRVRLATMFMDYQPVQVGTPIVASQCGDCEVCVAACPGQAATGRAWDVSVDRDVFYNARQCLETCRKLTREAMNESLSICGICVAVCPRGETR